MSTFIQSADVVIVGGGIAGLYTAWRLASNTNYNIFVLEYTCRFGGRFQTCIMPGGFPADMGAMRYWPSVHPILSELIAEFKLPTERLFGNDTLGKGIDSQLQRMETQGFLPMPDDPIILPENGNVYDAMVSGTKQKAKDMTIHQLLSLVNKNQMLINSDDPTYPGTLTVADNEGFYNLFRTSHQNSDDYMCIKGGMERLIHKLLQRLKSCESVKLLSSCPVTGVEETAGGFLVKTTDVSFQANRLVLACNARGLELITWTCAQKRVAHLRQLLLKVSKAKGFKLFLTFKTPWWEQFGLRHGTIFSYPPAFDFGAFGDRGKTSEYATLLAAFTYIQQDIFEGLNLADAEKFSNDIDSVPKDLVPSKRLVDFVISKIAYRMNIDPTQIPRPVCAATKIWNSDPIDAGNFQSVVGVDANELQWKTLKPFEDLPMYITGDTFTAVSKVGSYIGWSEGALLNSERILVNHFGLKPIRHGLSLCNEWPLSKL